MLVSFLIPTGMPKFVIWPLCGFITGTKIIDIGVASGFCLIMFMAEAVLT